MDDPSAVGVADGIRRQHALESGGIAGAGRVEERPEEAALGIPTGGPTAVAGEVLASATDELPGSGLGGLDDLRDAGVRVHERLAQDVGRPLRGREPLHQQQSRQLERFGALGAERRVVARVDGARKPRADVRLAARVRTAEHVDRETRRRGRQEGGRLAHRAAIAELPPHPGVLQDVLGIGRVAQDPVGDAEQHPS